jgi:hypothetical protein
MMSSLGRRWVLGLERERAANREMSLGVGVEMDGGLNGAVEGVRDMLTLWMFDILCKKIMIERAEALYCICALSEVVLLTVSFLYLLLFPLLL